MQRLLGQAGHYDFCWSMVHCGRGSEDSAPACSASNVGFRACKWGFQLPFSCLALALNDLRLDQTLKEF